MEPKVYELFSGAQQNEGKKHQKTLVSPG